MNANVVCLQRIQDVNRLAVVKRLVSSEEFSKVVPQACGIVWDAVKSQQLSGAGRHVAIYLDGETNLEVGVELEGPFAGYGEVIPSALPTGLAAMTTHYGPYQQLGRAHLAIKNWCKQNGYQLAGPNWEIYGHWQQAWNSDPSKISTEVYYLLRD